MTKKVLKFRVGGRVRLKEHPHIKGEIWKIVPRDNTVIIVWDDLYDEVDFHNPDKRLEKEP